MRAQRRPEILEQDKGVRRLGRRPADLHAVSRPTPNRPYSAVLVRRWPLLVLLVCTSSAWAAWSWGLHVNVSPSTPRGLYRTVSTPAARGAFVAVCPPLKLGRFAQERGYLGVGDCPGGVQAAIKRVVAVAGDTVDVGPTGVRVNDRPRELGRVNSVDVGEHLLARDPPVAGEREDEVGHDGPEGEDLGEQGLLERGAGRMLREGEERVAGPLAQELALSVGERVQAREVGLGDAYADGPGAETLGVIVHRSAPFLEADNTRARA